MSQFIASMELEGMTEQQLRAKYWQIIDDLARHGKAAEDCPHVYATLRNIEAAIYRLEQYKPQHKPKPPGFR